MRRIRKTKITYLMYGLYREYQYQIHTLLKKEKDNKVYNPKWEKILSDFSPKPIGYYSYNNKPIDDSVDLSIIVPMYNSELYIEKCLSSIIKQKTKYTYEIICIDDGSTDNTFNIVSNLFANDNNVRFILLSQKNRGFSGARNRGIDEAVGKYIMFVDSDDIIDLSAVEVLLDEAYRTDYDIVSGSYYTFNDDGIISLFPNKATRVPGKNERVFQQLTPFLWGKVYKRKLWFSLRLPEGYWFEDMISKFIISNTYNGFASIENTVYGYRKNSCGISATCNGCKKSIDQIYMVEFISNEMSRLNIERNKRYYKNTLKELGLFLYIRTYNLPQNIRYAVFSAACDFVYHWGNVNVKLNRCEQRALNAFNNKDFFLWEQTSKYWYDSY